MTTYGSSTNKICSISSAITGSPSGPSGNIIYFWGEAYNYDREFKFKNKQMTDGNSYTTGKGKVARKVDFRNMIILDDDGSATTNTQSLNNKITLMDSWQDLSGSPVYIIVTSQIDSVNLALSRSTGTTQLDYMKGYIKNLHVEPYGNVYKLSFTFVESTLL